MFIGAAENPFAPVRTRLKFASAACQEGRGRSGIYSDSVHFNLTKFGTWMKGVVDGTSRKSLHTRRCYPFKSFGMARYMAKNVRYGRSGGTPPAIRHAQGTAGEEGIKIAVRPFKQLKEMPGISGRTHHGHRVGGKGGRNRGEGGLLPQLQCKSQLRHSRWSTIRRRHFVKSHRSAAVSVLDYSRITSFVPRPDRRYTPLRMPTIETASRDPVNREYEMVPVTP